MKTGDERRGDERIRGKETGGKKTREWRREVGTWR